jgi:sulfatase maturation enzyme AslB (radical SAM superfamily)
MARVFYPLDEYKSSQLNYRLLPFRFLRLDDGSEILVNEVGEFVFAPNGSVHELVKKRLSPDSELYATLRSKQFLADSNSSALLDLLATKYRTKYSFIDGFTKLHIFVVTLRCDHSCQYCQVSRQTTDKTSYDMSLDTAERSVELMMRSPAKV